jgi:hypothetical protein
LKNKNINKIKNKKILEWAALSRLTGNPIYEEKARKAMDFLWNQRHRGSDLMGTVLNVNSGRVTIKCLANGGRWRCDINIVFLLFPIGTIILIQAIGFDAILASVPALIPIMNSKIKIN